MPGSHLYKMLALPGDNNTYGVGEGPHGASTRQAVIDSNTAWVKLAFYWFHAQPTAQSDMSSTWAHLNAIANQSEDSHLRKLDRQIRKINDDSATIGRPIAVLLTMYNDYPEWLYIPEDDQGWTWRGPRRQRIPFNVAVESPWSWVFAYLAWRYVYPGVVSSGPSTNSPPYFGNPSGARINGIEIVNEPNQHPASYGCWPQYNKDGCAHAAGQVAQMAKTADAHCAFLSQNGYPIGSIGPAVADTDNDTDTANITHYAVFTGQVLDALGGWVPSAYQAWSIHNYRDVATQSASRFETVANALNSRGPYRLRQIWLTEGGYPVDGSTESNQASRLNTNYFNLNNHSQAYNQCQWKMVDSSGESFQTGLRVIEGGSLRDRPAYAQWRQMPSNTSL